MRPNGPKGGGGRDARSQTDYGGGANRTAIVADARQPMAAVPDARDLSIFLRELTGPGSWSGGVAVSVADSVAPIRLRAWARCS